MKLQAGNTQIVVGKRVSVGAAILSTATGIAHFFPEHAPAIIAFATPLILIVQVLIGHFASITTRKNGA